MSEPLKEEDVLKMLEEPKNNIGQSPLDCCCDVFWEEIEEVNLEYGLDEYAQKVIIEGIKEVIVHWERIKSLRM